MVGQNVLGLAGQVRFFDPFDKTSELGEQGHSRSSPCWQHELLVWQVDQPNHPLWDHDEEWGGLLLGRWAQIRLRSFGEEVRQLRLLVPFACR